MNFQIVFAVFLGGGLGCVARFIASELITGSPVAVVSKFPLSTFVVNVAGCLLIGLFAAIFQNLNVPSWVRSMLVAGFCGGFTTFSTFGRENFSLFLSGEYFMAICYTGLSFLCGICAVAFGFYIGRSFV